MDVGGLWKQGVLVDGGCLRGVGYKRITGSRTMILEPCVRKGVFF